MRMLHILKFLHVFLGTVFLGGFLFSTAFIQYFILSKDNQKLLSALKFSFMLDLFFAIVIINQFLTGSVMVHLTHYSFRTDWIDAAYLFLGISTLLIVFSFLIKQKNYRLIESNQLSCFKYKKIYTIMSLLIFLMIILIIRDAILKTTLI